MRLQAGSDYSNHTAAVALLLQAAGMQQGTEVPTSPLDISKEQYGSAMDTSTHPPALRELGKAFQHGRGVEADQQLATRFFKRSAQLGDPAAQAQMAMRLAFGLQEASSFQLNTIQHFGSVDDASALTHYYFAAASGDSAARMALGYRHLFGIGVPANCWTAVSYYQPVAEQVRSTLPYSLFTGKDFGFKDARDGAALLVLRYAMLFCFWRCKVSTSSGASCHLFFLLT